jgi:predicted acetyltransferase
MRFRRATEQDLDRLVEIHFAAYPDGARNAQARRRRFMHDPLGGLRDLVVVEDGGEIVAHAFLFPLRAYFGGRRVPTGGIASLGVAPEARGRGVATALMHRLHEMARARGDAITMLYAFRHGFYARLGYATTSSRKRLAFDARSVPASWRVLAKSRVRAARGADRAALRLAHARAAARATGWIERTKASWDDVLSRERRLFFVCDPAERGRGPSISGYVAFELVQEKDHGETTIEVAELVADDGESRRALIGALAAMRDQVTEIVLEVPESDPLERALLDPDGRRFGTGAVEHGLGEIVGGPMVRLLDVERALAARGYERNGAFDLDVLSDETAPPLALRVEVQRGTARVGRRRARRSAARALETTRSGLAAMLYGGLSVLDAVALGLARADAKVAANVDAIVRLPPLAPIDAF